MLGHLRGPTPTLICVRPIAPGGGAGLDPREAQLDESLHEVECRLCHLTPAAVDRERVPAVRDPGDLGDGLVVLLTLVGGVGDRPRDRVVLLALDDQQRATGWIPGIDLGLGEGVEVCVRHLRQGHPGPGDVVRVV